MPLPHLLKAMDPPVPADVRAAADGLTYRDFLSVALVVPEADGFPDNWIYIHAPDVDVVGTAALSAASDPLAERLVAIDVEINPPSVLVTISDGNERPPPYLLENRTELPLLLHQKGAPPLLRRQACHLHTAAGRARSARPPPPHLHQTHQTAARCGPCSGSAPSSGTHMRRAVRWPSCLTSGPSHAPRSVCSCSVGWRREGHTTKT